ncbi:hypothetical protein [Mycoplasmopsis felis]|nr:hypothetical protein [Mycoplasmopsis felis]WQQ10282.1 hypothetical protein RRG49_00900 [Mycoplasmopsis felis]
MENLFLYEKLDVLKESGVDIKLPEVIENGLSKNISLKDLIKFKHLKTF